MRSARDFQIPRDRNLTGENLEILMRRQFSAFAARGGFNVFSSHYNYTDPRPTRETVPVGRVVVGARNIVLVNPLRMGGEHQDEVRGGEIETAIVQARTAVTEGIDPNSLEFVVPVQVGENHWVLAYLSPNGPQYDLTFIDSLYDMQGERNERARLAREEGVPEENIAARIKPQVSTHCAQIVRQLGGLIFRHRDLSCGQQNFAKSEALGEGKAPEGREYDDHFWSCGLITAENALMLATTGSVQPAREYTADSKERMFNRASATLREEARRFEATLAEHQPGGLVNAPRMQAGHQQHGAGVIAPPMRAQPFPHPVVDGGHRPVAKSAQTAPKKKGKISLYEADLLSQKVDAIVNPANEDMSLGASQDFTDIDGTRFRASGASGVSGAIHDDIGADVLANAMQIAAGRRRLPVGAAVATTIASIAGRNQKSRIEGGGIRHIIHAVGPDCRRGHYKSNSVARDMDLEEAYENAFGEALKVGARTIAVPTISTGIFEFPKEEAAKVIARVVKKYEGNFDEIKICTFDKDMIRLIHNELEGKKASPAVSQATGTKAAASVSERAKIEAELKKAYDELQKKQAEIEEEEEKLRKILINAPVKVLNDVLDGLQAGIKGLNFSSATSALLSICDLFKSVVSGVAKALIDVKESADKSSSATEKLEKSRKDGFALDDKVSELTYKRIAELMKAIVSSGKKVADNPEAQATALEGEKMALQGEAEKVVAARKEEFKKAGAVARSVENPSHAATVRRSSSMFREGHRGYVDL